MALGVVMVMTQMRSVRTGAQRLADEIETKGGTEVSIEHETGYRSVDAIRYEVTFRDADGVQQTHEVYHPVDFFGRLTDSFLWVDPEDADLRPTTKS